MRTFKEARGDTAVFTFGRFNPPTIGNEKLIEKVASEAKKVAGAPYYIYASHSENPKKEPLPYTKKVAYMKKMFPRYKKNIIVSRARNIFEVATELHNKGHKAVVMVVGSDRVSEFKSLLEELKKCEPEDEEKIKSITAKMAGCLEIPEKFQPPFVRENKK